jgi:hypothetical protein
MSEETKIAVYIPARASIYLVKADELQDKLDSLKKHKDILFRFFHVLGAEEEKEVRKALG